ncbi:MAG: T9SS type A sorting domain-containing protein [Bacteroidetes bacterium]|nr:T9SS type A sorting domain-containing protein [Bacteroidota bacterium]
MKTLKLSIITLLAISFGSYSFGSTNLCFKGQIKNLSTASLSVIVSTSAIAQEDSLSHTLSQTVQVDQTGSFQGNLNSSTYTLIGNIVVKAVLKDGGSVIDEQELSSPNLGGCYNFIMGKGSYSFEFEGSVKGFNWPGYFAKVGYVISEGNNKYNYFMQADSTGFFDTLLTTKIRWFNPDVMFYTTDCNKREVVKRDSNGSIFSKYSVDFDYCPNGYDSCVARFEAVQDTQANGYYIPYSVIIKDNSNVSFNVDYLWDFGDGNTSTSKTPTHSYSTDGPYYLCLNIKDPNGWCYDEFCDSIGVDTFGRLDKRKKQGFGIQIVNGKQTVGSQEIDFIESVYPNPVEDVLQIQFKKEQNADAQVHLFSLDGRLLLQSKIENNADENVMNLDLSNLHNGVYILNISSLNGSITKRVLKQ